MRHVVKHDNDNSDNEDDDEVMPMTKNMMLMRIMGMNMSRTTKGTTLMMYLHYLNHHFDALNYRNIGKHW